MTTVETLWLIVLILAVVTVLPLLVYLLHRAWRAARSIERYFAEMAQAGMGIAGNTAHIKALESTIGVATQILGVAGNINSHAETIKTTMQTRAGGIMRKPRKPTINLN